MLTVLLAGSLAAAPPSRAQDGSSETLTGHVGTHMLVPGDTLPQGFYLVPGDGMKHPSDAGVLYGSTVQPGAHAFTVRVEDATGRRADKLMIIEVAAPNANSESSGCTCVAARPGLLGAPVLLAVAVWVSLSAAALGRRRRWR